MRVIMEISFEQTNYKMTEKSKLTKTGAQIDFTTILIRLEH